METQPEALVEALAELGASAQDTFVVAYSGGADSTCLLDLAHRAGLRVSAAHLHHGMRPEADEEMVNCEAYCEPRGIPFVGGRSDVPKASRAMKVGLEEAGRILRYEFFQKAALRTRSLWILTGHTADDHAETVVLNLARGTGLNGLSGIPAKRNNILRPILKLSREQTRAYCTENSLWFHDDPANDDSRFTRSFVRKEIMPLFRRLNPQFVASVQRLADIVEEESRVLNHAAAMSLEQAEVPMNGDLRFLTSDAEAHFRKQSLAELPRGLVRRAVMMAAACIGGKCNFEQTEAIVEGLASPDSGSVTLDGGDHEVVWNDDAVFFRTKSVERPAEFPLTFPGETVSDTMGWMFVAQECAVPQDPKKGGGLTAFLDHFAVSGELFIKPVEPSDAIVPLGMTGHRKVSDVLSSMSLSPLARARLPIVCDRQGPIWVPGGVLAERVKITGETRSAIRLTFGPKNSETFGEARP